MVRDGLLVGDRGQRQALLTRLDRPEDILGSVEVDSYGTIVGNFQPSGTYRIVTNEGM